MDKPLRDLQKEIANLEVALDFVFAHPNAPGKRIELREQLRKLKAKLSCPSSVDT